MGSVVVKIWSVSWRGGKPRFNPGPKLRRLGYKGEDLRHPGDGPWFSLDEAVAWADAKRKEVAARRAKKLETGRLPPLPRQAIGPTIADLFQEWYASPKFTGGVRQGKREERGLSAASIRDYKGKARVLCAFDPDGEGAFGSEHPAAVIEIVAQAVYERLWELKGLHMARGVVAVASSCWRWAGKRGRMGVKQNPWRAVEKTTPDPRLVIWDDHEVVALVAACDAPDKDGIRRPELGDAIYLGLFTGQRQGDRLALHDAGRDDRGRRLFKQSKTGAIVAIPEAPQLRARLEAAAARRRLAFLGFNVNPHVILDERQRAPFRGDHYRHLFAERRALAAVACPSLAGKRDLDLRDTAVTWLARADCTIPQIASITGHSFASIHNVLKHYLALHPEMADAAIGKLVAWMEDQGMAV